MAEPASNTTYPSELDPLPAIGPNDKQNDPALEHDVMHDRVHALLNALQALLGYGEEPEGSSVLGQLAALEAAIGEGISDRASVTTIAHGAAGVLTIDVALGDYFVVNLAANVTGWTFANLPPAGKGVTLSLIFVQDAIGERTVALPATFKATGGSDVVVQSGANARTKLVISSVDAGTLWDFGMQEIGA